MYLVPTKVTNAKETNCVRKRTDADVHVRAPASQGRGTEGRHNYKLVWWLRKAIPVVSISHVQGIH